MTLDENDYLTYQLYTASRTPRIKRARLRGWIMTVATFAGLAFLFYRSENDFLGNYFVVCAGLSLIFFPFYSRWRYKKHYQKNIRDTYKNRFGEECSLEFTTDTIVTADKSGEVRINKSEIEKINEIKDFYFIKIRNGTSLIISKNKSDNLEKIKGEIESMIKTQGIKHNPDLDWKWR